ncbi:MULTISPECIES: polysaccharide deacetylase [Paenibacillus]|uniref:Xylanase deacetylase n=2 Tax=Paenibacillus TaxID=44249 RepID=A0ABX2ZEI1_PAEPO|nr:MULTISPECIES: polysaccharide deacetylase [Paenibacillus]MCP3744806.1 polysaccharide deacetylase family protein [Paenibacillus sp. A3M_27_13]MDR6778077.1 peptidoglycan/xylan/chitin deacetylase (PgdA/CDA1 family) [Paenibacillus peoriae]ODA08964.1 xylanase deacetylase [Paenibacillus polymyxa]OME75339.1 xylanase deacetylase [Paenibacillus peoriae]
MKLLNAKWMAVCLMAICCLGLLGIHTNTASAQAKAPLLGVNDVLLDSNTIQPVMKNDKLYVPIVTLGQKMGISTSANGNTLVLTGHNRSFTLDLNKGDVFERGDRTMVPIRTLTDAFGFTITLPTSNLYRIQNANASLSDAQFLNTFATQIKQYAAVKPGKASNSGNKGTASSSSRTIYLSFDDGPTAHTSQLLDILDKYNAKATFFMLGPEIRQHSAVMKRMVEAGHGLGLHGMTHQVKKIYASPAAALAEMNQDNEILFQATGKRTSLIRTPYGSKPYLKKAYRDQLTGAGYHIWDWNIDSNDWRYTKNPEHFVQTVLSDIRRLKKQGRTPVVLMHDKPSTIKVLPQIMAALQKEGYSFEPLNDNLTPLNFWNDHR